MLTVLFDWYCQGEAGILFGLHCIQCLNKSMLISERHTAEATVNWGTGSAVWHHLAPSLTLANHVGCQNRTYDGMKVVFTQSRQNLTLWKQPLSKTTRMILFVILLSQFEIYFCINEKITRPETCLGTNLTVPDAPFMVGIVEKHDNQKILCSAGLLNYKWAITTPNCTEEYDHEPEFYTVSSNIHLQASVWWSCYFVGSST